LKKQQKKRLKIKRRRKYRLTKNAYLTAGKDRQKKAWYRGRYGSGAPNELEAVRQVRFLLLSEKSNRSWLRGNGIHLVTVTPYRNVFRGDKT